MRKFALLVCLAAVAGFTACSGETKTPTEATTTSAMAGDTATVLSTDTVATGAPLDSVHHAHLHESKGMVHNHEHGHPAADTAHHGQ